MSQLKTNSIANVAGTASTDVLNVINGSAKAWVNFNGTGTVAIRAAYNVSSITDNGTGNYTVNFTTAFADVNYSVTACANGNATNNNSGLILILGTSNWGGANTMSTTQVQVACSSSSSTTSFADVGVICIAIFR